MADMTISEKVEQAKHPIFEELINEEELQELFAQKQNPVAYDGFEPSGQIHIAQGLLRAISINKLTRTGIKFKIFLADYFAMLNNKFGGDLEKIQIAGRYAIEVWKSSGMDLSNVEFVWASQFYEKNPQYWQTVMKLAMNTTVSRVLKCGQIMGREESNSNPSAQILYPLMQAADIHHLGADIAQLGMDQRKVNMLARDVFPKIGLKKPIALHHKMLMGLVAIESELTGTERKIALKMSKSKPDTAIFMTDSHDDIVRKFKKAYCPEAEVKDNPILEYCKYIIFERLNQLEISRPEKFGGNVTYKTYDALEADFVAKKLHPMDLKAATAQAISTLLEPTRAHFQNDATAAKLLEQVKSFNVTR